MEIGNKCYAFTLLLVCVITFIETSPAIPDEKWGYHTVRENAHMFWWLYGAEETGKREELPLVLWLQGGPGGSGTGFGNFIELGPLDINLKPRNTTWLKKANILFIDNPVGAGFSYVSHPSAYTRNVTQIAEDLFVLFSYFLDQLPVFKTIPFYIFCESYGGTMTAVFGQRLYEGIQKKDINCNFKGVALGDSWISYITITSWGPYLYNVNLLDDNDLQQVTQLTNDTLKYINEGLYLQAMDQVDKTMTFISDVTDNVNIYNILQHNQNNIQSNENILMTSFHRQISHKQFQSLTALMNGVIRKKLGIISDDVIWGGQSVAVGTYLREDFLKPVLKSVDKLLEYGLKVIVYQGQLDMICNTVGAELWVQQLSWEYLDDFLKVKRTPLYVAGKKMQTQAFLKSFKNFSFYYILNAGHMVPVDNGEMALDMLDQIISQ